MRISQILRSRAWAACLVAGATLAHAQSVPGPAAKEALVRAVTNWNAGCTGNWRPSWDDMAGAWYNEIRDTDASPAGHGSKAWAGDGLYADGNIVDSDFIDPDLATWGRDDWNDRLDDVDAAMVAMHGGHNNGTDNWLGTVRVDEAGSGNCWANQALIAVGDTDLEFLHISSCHSLCEQNWGDWFDSFAGLHQVDGFYGLMYISTTYIDRYEDFGDDAFNIGIGPAWIDNHYDPGIYTDGVDHCPVAMVVGTSASNVVNRMFNEQYDWVYSDPVNPGHQWIYFVEGCDPSGHGPLPTF